MAEPAAALRLLGRAWLEEVRPADRVAIAALPRLAAALPDGGDEALVDLAVEHQRLFGLSLPPYESVFVDPSAMLGAPATARVQALYRRFGWRPPPDIRSAGEDHVGLELMAVADWIDAGHHGPARRLHARHLALWVPPLTHALGRLAPDPFYGTLADLTVEWVLGLPPVDPGDDPFPSLPPPPAYRASTLSGPVTESEADDASPRAGEPDGAPGEVGLHDVLRRLLVPREAGLYLTGQDLARAGRSADLPTALGDRRRTLESLLRLAGQYDALAALADALAEPVADADRAYGAWSEAYPGWAPYAAAWRRRLAGTRALLAEMRAAGSI